MMKLLLFTGLLGLCSALHYDRIVCPPGEETIYQFSAVPLDQSPKINFTQYEGSVVLIYNVATYTNITVQSYNQINALADNFDGQPFEILGFPTNEFGKGEPGSGYDEILNGIRYVRPGGGFEPKMTFFEATNINGDRDSNFFAFLKSSCMYVSDTFSTDIYYSPENVDDVRWNFEKFLVGKDGKVYFRYHPNQYEPDDLIPDIENLLNA